MFEAMTAAGGVLKAPGILNVMPVGAGTMQISSAQLDTLLNQAVAITLTSQTLFAGRSEAELTTRLEFTSWSVAQCLDHLAQTTNAFVPALSCAVARAPRLTTDRRLRTGALTRLFIGNLKPPYRLRFKVPASLAPRVEDFGSAWGAFEKSQAELEKTILSARGLAVDRVRVESPVYARFSYNVYGALRMLIAHEYRHIWQIERILRALDETARPHHSLKSHKIYAQCRTKGHRFPAM
jgi:hypothetical protein